MDELLGRRVPWSAEAEQAVLGSCLIDPACLSEVLTAVRAADFYLDVNREIFDTIFNMFTFGMAIDPVTVLDQMKVRGVFNPDSSPQYIRELMRVTPTAANVLKYAAIVRDQALLRNVIQVCEETMDAASTTHTAARNTPSTAAPIRRARPTCSPATSSSTCCRS